MGIAQVDIHIENKVRDLLNHARDGKICTNLLCVLHIAATAGLQVTAVRCSIDRRNVENGKFSGFRHRLAQLIAGVHQPPLFVRPRPIHFALQAGIDQFEVEHSDFERIGMCRR